MMAAKTSGHKHGRKLRHCHPMYLSILDARVRAAANQLHIAAAVNRWDRQTVRHHTVT